MKACVIEDDNLAWGKIGRQNMFDPEIEDIGRAMPVEAERAVQASSAQSGNGGGAACTIAGLVAIKPLAARRPAMRETRRVVDTGLVDINQPFDRQRSDQFLEDLPPRLVAFLIAEGLFLKVNPICFNRFQMSTPLTPKCLPISISVRSGYAAT